MRAYKSATTATEREGLRARVSARQPREAECKGSMWQARPLSAAGVLSRPIMCNIDCMEFEYCAAPEKYICYHGESRYLRVGPQFRSPLAHTAPWYQCNMCGRLDIW
jgi:hypothetical protein